MPSPHEIRSVTDIGHVVRATRIAAGLTQADAAALCGVSGPFLNGLEQGKSTARIGLVLKVCWALGIQLSAHPPGPVLPPGEGPKRKPRGNRR